jgi:hypothetical protein
MDGLIVNKFNLFSNKLLITGEFREWVKLKTMVKNEILNIELIEDLFYYNFTYELNWNKSIYFVSNLNKYSKRETGDSNVHIKLKIF